MSDSTYYEVALQTPSGDRYRLGYTARHSASGLMAMVDYEIGRRVLAVIGREEVSIDRMGGGARARLVLGDTGAAIIFTGDTRKSTSGINPAQPLPAVS